MTFSFGPSARRLSLAGVGLAYACFVLLGIPGHMAATDSTYHFGIAARIWGGDLAPDPSTSYPWTAWRDLPVDHYWGFHVLIVQTHPSIDLYAGARPVLESHAGAPVGNLVLGDGNLLLWEWPDVQVAQGGSPYFLFYCDPSLYTDLHTLHDAPSDAAVDAAIERMRGRGTRLLSVRAALPFHGFAARHPDRVRQVYAHPRYLTSLYEILPPR